MKLLKYILYVIFLSVIFHSCKTQQTADYRKLDGIWTGSAHQYDIDESWDIYFIMDIKNQKYTIDYPLLNCGGKWTLLKSDMNTLEFRETLNRGEKTCTNNGKIILELKKDNQIEFFYYWPDDVTLNAQGSLSK